MASNRALGLAVNGSRHVSLNLSVGGTGHPEGGYEPNHYWEERLRRDFNLRGVGHREYSQAYNAWLYRAKRRALTRGLDAVQPGPALDVGSGTGWVVEELRLRGFPVEGCDITAIAVKRLRDRFPKSEFFELSLGTDPIPRPDRSFALVTALDVLYHIVDDEGWAAGLSEIARVLAPDGRLIATDGLGEGDSEPAAHVKLRSRERWLREAAAVGLRLERELPLYRWLSRERGRWWGLAPDNLRGALEYTLERVAPRAPHMRLAVFAKVR